MSSPFDFGRLVNALTNNGQAHLPPQDVIRMGEIVGYDPNWDSSSGAHSYPMVSVKLAGDENPMHGLRFAESYIPNLGDTVFVVVAGEDGWVLSSLAGANKDVIGQARSPVSLLKGSAFTDTTVVPSNGNVTTLASTDQTVPYLPNRIYRIEATVTFKVSGVAQVAGSVGVTPAITATNDAGSGSVTIGTLDATAQNNAGSGGVAIGWTTPKMMAFKASGSSGALFITWDTTAGVNNTPIAQLIALYNLNGELAIVDVDGSSIDSGTVISATNGGISGNRININNTLNAAIPTHTFLAFAQVPPTATPTWPAITANVTGSPAHVWPHITTTASSTGSFTNTTQNSEVSIGVISPDGYQEMVRYDVTGAKDNQEFTTSATTTFWKIPSGPVSQGSWTSTFNWNLAMQSVGTVKPTITNISQRFLVYDCGVAS